MEEKNVVLLKHDGCWFLAFESKNPEWARVPFMDRAPVREVMWLISQKVKNAEFKYVAA